MTFLEKDLQIGADSQKLVATDDGDNSANPLVLGNDSLNESDEKKKLLMGKSVVGWTELLTYFNTAFYPGSDDDTHAAKSSLLDRSCEHSDGCWYNNNPHDHSRI